MKADDIINRARTELENFIKFEVIQLYYKLYGRLPDDEQTFAIEDRDFCSEIVVKLTTYFASVDVEHDCVIYRVINKNNELSFEIWNEEDDEMEIIHCKDLGTDELKTIANTLEKTFKS